MARCRCSGGGSQTVGTTAGTVAAGDDARIAGAAQKAANLSDLANAGTARTNLGLGTAAVTNTGTGATNTILGNDARLTDARAPLAHDAALVTSGVFAAARIPADIPQVINNQTGTTYTVVLADAGKIVTNSNAAAITVTLPTDASAAISVGSRVDFIVIGAGMVTFAAAGGATVNGTPSLVTRAQWSAVTAVKIAANTWVVIGDLA